MLSLPDTGILLSVTHARLLALRFTIGDALSTSAFATLYTLSAVGHVEAHRTIGSRAGAEGLLLASGKVGRSALGTH